MHLAFNVAIIAATTAAMTTTTNTDHTAAITRDIVVSYSSPLPPSASCMCLSFSTALRQNFTE